LLLILDSAGSGVQKIHLFINTNIIHI